MFIIFKLKNNRKVSRNKLWCTSFNHDPYQGLFDLCCSFEDIANGFIVNQSMKQHDVLQIIIIILISVSNTNLASTRLPTHVQRTPRKRTDAFSPSWWHAREGPPGHFYASSANSRSKLFSGFDSTTDPNSTSPPQASLHQHLIVAVRSNRPEKKRIWIQIPCNHGRRKLSATVTWQTSLVENSRNFSSPCEDLPRTRIIQKLLKYGLQRIHWHHRLVQDGARASVRVREKERGGKAYSRVHRV